MADCWSKYEVEVLREEYAKGTSPGEITIMLDRSYEAIIQKARREGVASGCIHWASEEIEILRKGYENGIPTGEIASILGKSREAVIAKAGREDLVHPYKRILISTGLRLKDFGSYQKMLLYILQGDDQHCVRCGRRNYLTVNHKMPGTFKPSTTDEYKRLCTLPNPEEEVEVLCLNCNKLHYYDYEGITIKPSRRRALIKIASAYKDRGVECFECGYDEDIRILEVDHKIPDGLCDVGLFYTIIRMPLDEVRKKYQILCSNCNKWKETIYTIEYKAA